MEKEPRTLRDSAVSYRRFCGKNPQQMHRLPLLSDNIRTQQIVDIQPGIFETARV